MYSFPSLHASLNDFEAAAGPAVPIRRRPTDRRSPLAPQPRIAVGSDAVAPASEPTGHSLVAEIARLDLGARPAATASTGKRSREIEPTAADETDSSPNEKRLRTESPSRCMTSSREDALRRSALAMATFHRHMDEGHASTDPAAAQAAFARALEAAPTASIGARARDARARSRSAAARLATEQHQG